MIEAKKSKTTKKTAAKKTESAKEQQSAYRDTAFNPRDMEPKWQAKWEADKLYRAVIDESRQKFYALTMLPYPSGDLTEPLAFKLKSGEPARRD